MMTLLGHGGRMCDGISRRSFLKIGGLAMGAAGGLGLPSLLRASAAAGQPSSSKAVIHIFLAGGPPHHLYVCPVDSPALAAHLRFRDALRANRELAGRYGALKRELAAQFGADRDAYCEAKTAFIQSVLDGQPPTNRAPHLTGGA